MRNSVLSAQGSSDRWSRVERLPRFNLLTPGMLAAKRPTFDRAASSRTWWVKPWPVPLNLASEEKTPDTRGESFSQLELFSSLSKVFAAIQDSEKILELGADWDSEGAVAYDRATWLRARDFVWRTSVGAFQVARRSIPIPEILPASNGSIDVHWKTDKFELLVNIPPGIGEPASFYGDDYGALRIKGSLNPRKVNAGLVLWLCSQGVNNVA